MPHLTPNATWRITFGDYDLALDRRDLSYRLVETKSNTLWADGLSVGWLELTEIATGERTRHHFGAMKRVTLSEKSGATGKRILFGLDCLGVPVDAYFTCSQREIQFTVEASRDTRTHRVEEVCLLPGLVSAPNDGFSYLVVPRGEGMLLAAADVPETPSMLPIWDAGGGVTMPFVGAVRVTAFDTPVSALALMTDSAYGAFRIGRGADGAATVDVHYACDPERRRLDLRVAVFPEANHVAVARAYRDKLIADGNHITLRKKLRKKPALEAYVSGDTVTADQVLHTTPETDPADDLGSPLRDDTQTGESRWDDMDRRLEMLRAANDRGEIVAVRGGADWSAIECDVWMPGNESPVLAGRPAPLRAVVYHDSVVTPVALPDVPTAGAVPAAFLRALIALSPPLGPDSHAQAAILAALHRLTFAAFVIRHRYLTPDVEEVHYSNGTVVIVNHGFGGAAYDDDFVLLPPGGFFAEHATYRAHDALRVAQDDYFPRAIRVVHAQDGESLAASSRVVAWEARQGGESTTTAIALGSNLGDREANLAFGRDALAAAGVRWTRISSLYETEPVGPVAKQPAFLNQVAVGETSLPPLTLLDMCLEAERQRGRVRDVPWGPRTLDLDILLYGAERIADPRLTAPHPELVRRAFVLVPLAEVAGDIAVPGTDGWTVADLLAALPAAALEGVRLWRSSDTR
jgi:2-amino-4-hydroxy-6-hydroxymethyldihydropteridine diphosphokinase